MKKKLSLIWAAAIGIVLVIGSVVATLVISPLLTAGTNSNAAANGNAANGSSASGAVVIAWNKELLHIVLTPGAQPATVHPTRSFAILHAAIYDTVVSITRDAPPFLFSVNAPSTARADIAAAQAGHDTLVALYPRWKAALDQQLAGELAALPNGAGKQGGSQVGQAVAARLLAMRATDGSAATPPPFAPGNQPGNYQLTPPKFAAPIFTNWSNVTPFVLHNAAQFRPGPPPAVTSQAYAQALNEVKSLGQNTSTTRTPEQTVIGKFWAGPIWNTWNEIAENAALAHHTNLETTARLFSVLNLSFADSVIAFYKEALTGGGFTALLESAAQQVLAVTYWFDPAPHVGPYPITVRFSGRRIDVKGRLSPGDRFVQDESIEEVVPGSGPISLTTRVRGINPGEWLVTARMLGSAHPAHGPREQGNASPAAGPPGPIARFWHRWAPSAESAEHVRTCPTPLARVPGIFPGIWGAMVTLGIAVALALQFLVISAEHLALGPVWMVSLVAIVAGIAGAKGWFIVLHRRERRIEGWCIQGFIAGATLAAAILLTVLDVPAGVLLDVTAPGLLVGVAVGRVGCFLAGCCGGPPTASRWGVWSSDQRVGARRIPTQLLESVLALSLGLGVLVAVLGHGPVGGAFFVAGLAAYTLGRQGLLRLRAEPRKTRLGGLATSALASLVLIAAIILLTR